MDRATHDKESPQSCDCVTVVAQRYASLGISRAYRQPNSVAHDPAELVSRLRALNRDISEGKHPYAPFG